MITSAPLPIADKRSLETAALRSENTTPTEDQSASLLPTPRSGSSSPFLVPVNFGHLQEEEEGDSASENNNNENQQPPGSFHNSNNSSGGETPKPPTNPHTAAAVSAPSPSSTSRKTQDSSNSGNNNAAPTTIRLAIGDQDTTSSNQYFLSEPSLSPDDGEDDESRIRAPHRLPITGGRAFRHRSSSDDDLVGGGQAGHNQPPRFAQASPVPSSPGNTSLSSWDSPNRTKNRVWLQFTPSAFRSSGSSTQAAMSAAGGTSQPSPSQQQQLLYGETNSGPMLRVRSPDRASVQTPPTNSGKQFTSVVQTDNTNNSYKSNGGNHTSSPSLPLPSLKESAQRETPETAITPQKSPAASADAPASTGTFRRLMDGIKDADSVSDSLIFDTSIAAGGQSPAGVALTSPSGIRINGQHHSRNLAEESIIMDLSDSEDDAIVQKIAPMSINDGTASSHPHPSRTSTFDSEYMQEQTADDEKTTTTDADLAPPKPHQHRQYPIVRARSGDAAAASLATGGTEWIGMKMDNIPLPAEDEEEEDDEEDEILQEVDDKRHVQDPPERKPDPSPPAQHTSMRPPKPEPRAGASVPAPVEIPPPPAVGPPPPQMTYPTEPNYVQPHLHHQAEQQVHGQHYQAMPEQTYGEPYQHAQPSPSVSSHHSLQNNSPRMPQQQYWHSHDGFVPHQDIHRQTPYADVHHQWFETQPKGDSAMLRERINSFSSLPKDFSAHQPPQSSNRRFSWGSGAGEHLSSSVRSSHSHSVASEHESHHSAGGTSHHSEGGHRSVGSGAAAERGETASSESSDEDEQHDNFDEGGPMHVKKNQFLRGTEYSVDRREELEHIAENRDLRGAYQHVARSRSRDLLGSPFANIGKQPQRQASKADFFPATKVADEDRKKFKMYTCPRCNKPQREFFTVATAPKQFEGPTGYLAAYFVLYVTASLFIFGLEEGWEPLDCIYFAVISLTTAGLGDYVPTTDSNKIICSIFIYFGVACIGLLLGSYIANMLDDKAYTDAKARQIDSCPNCARLRAGTPKHVAEVQSVDNSTRDAGMHKSQNDITLRTQAPKFSSERVGMPSDGRNCDHHAVYTRRQKHHHPHQNRKWSESSMGELPADSPPPPPPSVPPPVHPFHGSSPQFSLHSAASPQPNQSAIPSPSMLGSPMTRQILERQSHSRHASFDIGQKFFGRDSAGSNGSVRKVGQQTFQQQQIINEEGPKVQAPVHSNSIRSKSEHLAWNDTSLASSDDLDESSDGDDSSEATDDHIVDERLYKIKAAKYVFLTLQEALGNSLVILAVGCVGFYLIENFTLVDSWYFTTVLLTTTGYGDIVPVTRGGKLFATIYLLVGGTILLNNMSMISMIPLELRKRRNERAVLTQFGDNLDDAGLEELAQGPLIKRLSLKVDRVDGLAECTREMFALAMLVRLGKVSEDDIKQTFAAFRRLDPDGEGVLNSKSIIAGLHRQSTINPLGGGGGVSQQNLQPHIPRTPPGEEARSMRGHFWGRQGSLHIQTAQGNVRYAPPPGSEPSEASALLQQQAPQSAGYQSGSSYPPLHPGTSPSRPPSHPYPSPYAQHHHPPTATNHNGNQF